MSLRKSFDINASMLPDRKCVYTGVLLGIVLNANFIAGAITSIGIHINNIFAYIVVICTVMAVLANKCILQTGRKQRITVGIILLQLLFGKLLVNSPMSERFLICFISIGLPCLIISSYSFDIYSILTSIIVSSACCFPYCVILLHKTYTVYNAGEQMGIAYSLLPGIVAALILLLRQNSFGIKLLSVIVLSIETMILFRMMTRGAYLCLALFIIGYMYMIYKQDKNSKHKIGILAVALIAALLLCIFSDVIITSNWYYRVFGKKAGNILNGREADLKTVFRWRGFLPFLFGSGVGSFQKFEYTEYIHNVLGQVYYEQGIFSVIFVVAVIFRAIKIIWSDRTDITKSFVLMLFCIGIARLMVSYYFWIDSYFWILTWLMLKKNSLCKYE